MKKRSSSIGYKLSSEEQAPRDLVRYAQMAEDSGFHFALISDHFHPWTDRQGQKKGFFEFYEREILPHLGSIHGSHRKTSGPHRRRRR